MRRDHRQGRLAKSAFATGVVTLALGAAASGAQAVTISPLNGTPDASPDTQISFLGVPASQIAHVSVDGSRSGSHSGRLRSYASAVGASFLPARGFSLGERVSVSAVVGPRGHTARVGTSFTVARLVDYPLPPEPSPPPAKAGANQSFVSQPKLHPPTVRVTTSSPAATPGDIFLDAHAGRGQNGAMIIDGSGRLIWFQPAAAGDAITNLKPAIYAGKQVLTFWQGHIDLGVGFGSDTILGTDYQPVASVGAGNGYMADLHELQLAPQGSAFLSAYTLVRADLSSVGGSTDGALQDAVVQQIDVPTGLVMYEWHAYGHVALDDSYATSPSDANRPWDFFHLNSIDPDPWGDGNFLISSRNTWAAYEVNQASGSILWRIGGKAPSFRMGAGTGTAFQHDARWQPDHTITIFDNGATPKAHTLSRAIHEAIDFKHRTVKLLGRLVRTPSLLSGSQGDDQVLGGGDSFVGWGEDPYFTEFNAAGQMVFDGHLPAPAQVYRAFRFPWNATPAAPPAIAVKAAGAATTVYASWNGATNVASWSVLGGASPAALTTLTTVPTAGFETAITVQSAAPVFAVQALGPAGEALGSSHAIAR
ncbi:MAG: arylsulfotransferase family protein [Solirubrobacteraceae bacterium]